MIKGIIFDLDGTTLNTLYDIEDSVNKTLAYFNYEPRTYDEVRMAIGNGSRNLIKKCLPDNCDDETIDKTLKKYLEVYNNNYDVKTIPYEGMVEVLEKIQDKNILIGFNSNKPDNLTKALIKKNYPKIKPIEIIGQSDKYPIKPDPTGVNVIIEKMGLNKSEVLYVGDSGTDVKTAKNAKLKCIGCEWGFRGRNVLIEAKADYIVSKPEEILNYVK